jgi:hypothetical protein
MRVMVSTGQQRCDGGNDHGFVIREVFAKIGACRLSILAMQLDRNQRIEAECRAQVAGTKIYCCGR